MSVPATLDIITYKGDTLVRTFTFTQDGAPIDMTGSSVLFQIGNKKPNGDLLKQITHLVGGSWTSINEFTINSIIDIEAGIHFYDLQITSPSGVTTTYLKGKIKVEQDVSFIN